MLCPYLITHHLSLITDIAMTTQTNKQAIWNAQIVKRAIVDSFVKLNPRKMMGNPVMFVVEVGSVLTTLQLIRGIIAPIPGVTNTGFELQITLWLWFTVLFANFAEAMAEGRGQGAGGTAYLCQRASRSRPWHDQP